jgi:hypothetical protein
VSAGSFALQIGGVAGSLLVSRLAEATNATVAFGAVAAALLLIGVISLGLRAPAGTPGPAPTTVEAETAQRSNAVG